MLDFQYDEQKCCLTCVFAGNLGSEHCTETANAVETRIHAITGAGLDAPPDEKLGIVFDLGKAEYVSSAFIRVILRCARRVRKGNFSIVKPNPFVKETIRTSGLEQLIADGAAEIESVLYESRVFVPSAEFRAQALVASMDQYRKLYQESISEPEAFWARQGREHIAWFEPWQKTLEWQAPDVCWFKGGVLNVAYNCLDRHLGTSVENKTAIIWEGEPCASGLPVEIRKLTYRQLHAEVCRFSNVLKKHGIHKGDRVVVYMPMVPEAVVAMLACARIGAIHSVIFGGFSAQAIADRVKDSAAKIIITADGGYRRGAIVPLKQNVDESFAILGKDGEMLCASVAKVIVLRRTAGAVRMEAGRDLWWHEEMQSVNGDCLPEKMRSEDTLFILYTSGSTGKPKGIYHTSGGYLLGAKLSHKYVFDVRENDVYWCTADIGWITGHSYIVYGPLANASTVLMYEGAPNFPEQDRFWRIVERHGVTIFYTAPTAIRAFMQWGEKWPERHDLSSLRLLGSVGEPINPQAWIWYHKHIGREQCPIVDTWWQTETGSIMITTLPGAMPGKPGSAGVPFFGVQPEIVNDAGKPVQPNSGGKLVVRSPWPSMLRGVWGDRERFEWTYWSDLPGNYFTGDGARRDKDGYFWIMGRIDDVINVAGHRIGTAEVESALVSHPSVAEAAVVGRPDDVKGFGLVAFVALRSDCTGSKVLSDELRLHVGREVGQVAKPDEIRFAQSLPKTRSGKIMRRLLKQVAAGVEISGDVTTLEDFNVLAKLTAEEG